MAAEIPSCNAEALSCRCLELLLLVLEPWRVFSGKRILRTANDSTIFLSLVLGFLNQAYKPN
jgi:hypothetical protein